MLLAGGFMSHPSGDWQRAVVSTVAWLIREKMNSHRGARTFLTAGLPFVTFIVGGSYMLSEFVSGQVHVKDVRRRSKSLREFDIEEEHRHIMKQFNDDFEIKRVPRPGE